MTQQAHYDRIADVFVRNLGAPHTEAYSALFDRLLLEAIPDGPLGHIGEICCGRGDALRLLGNLPEHDVTGGVGIDISSAMLDADSEHPLHTAPTRRQLAEAGLDVVHWRTCGAIGYCLFMNSDVLVVNRLLRHVPGIRRIARAGAALDERLLRLPWLRHAGLQVVGAARKRFEHQVPREPRR